MKLQLIFSAIQNIEDGEMRLAQNERAFDQYYSWNEFYIGTSVGFILGIGYCRPNEGNNQI